MAKTENKTATFKMKQKAPKKGSVLFESTEPDQPLQAIYLMRSGAEKHLGVSDLDKVTEIEVSVKAV